MNLIKLFSKNTWRTAAKKHSRLKRLLKKRNKELTKSRDNFRNKYYKLKKQYEELEKNKKEIEKELKKTEH